MVPGVLECLQIHQVRCRCRGDALLAAVAVFFIKRPTDPDFFYTSLGYDVQVLDNGDLHIGQTIDAHLNRREDSAGNVQPWLVLFQRDKIDAAKIKGISRVSVMGLDAHLQYRETAPFSSTSEVQLLPFWDQLRADTWYMAKVNGNSPPPPAGMTLRAVRLGSASRFRRIAVNPGDSAPWNWAGTSNRLIPQNIDVSWWT